MASDLFAELVWTAESAEDAERRGLSPLCDRMTRLSRAVSAPAVATRAAVSMMRGERRLPHETTTMRPLPLTSLFALLAAALGLGLAGPRDANEATGSDAASLVATHAAAHADVHTDAVGAHDTLSRDRATAAPALEGVAPIFTFGAPLQRTGHTHARGAHPLLAGGALFAAHATHAHGALTAALHAPAPGHVPRWRAPGLLRASGDDDEPS